MPDQPALAAPHTDVIFLIDERKETALASPIANLGDSALVVRLSDAPGITLWSLREGGAFEMHTHGHDEDDHDDEEADDEEGATTTTSSSMASSTCTSGSTR